MASDCPSPAILHALLAESLAPDEQARWTAHLDGCADCRAKLESLAAGDVVPEPRPVNWHPAVAGRSKLMAVIRNLKTSIDQTTVGNRPDIPITLDFLQPSDKPDLLGTFGPYEITSLLGHGGMGIVLGGFDPKLQRKVAIKVMLPHWASQASARERFLREARAAAAVVHENVVAIHAVDEERGLPYLVMQLVAGWSLQKLLDERGPLDAKMIARLGAEIAEGLAAAHAKGLVHRDIKPSNILLDDQEQRVKISDFGLAKASDDVSLTRSGTLAGTPEYMAPEQAAEGPVDARADLFALGSVLYAMASGHPPFRGDSAYAVIRQVCEVAPKPLSAIRDDLPASLVAIIERLLQKNPAERYSSAAEVSADLRGYPNTNSLLPYWFPRPLHLAVIAFAGCVLLLIAMFVGWLWKLATSDTDSAGQNQTKKHDVPGAVTSTNPGPEDPAEKKPLLTKLSGFYLAGRTEPFASLQEAVLAAPPEGVIEVYGDGPFVVTPMQIAGKPLTIRAAAGSRAVLESPSGAETPDRSLFETDASLTLEGLDIRWSSTSRRPRDNETEEVAPHTALVIRGGKLRLANCRLSIAMNNCAIGLLGGSCQVVDSLLVSPNGPGIVVHMQPGIEVVLENSILSGRSGIVPWIDDMSTGGGETKVRLTRSTICSQAAFHCVATGTLAADLPTSDTPRLVCEGHGCVFDCARMLVIRPAPPIAGAPLRPARNLGKLTSQANWIGSENVYSNVIAFISVIRGGQGFFPLTRTFDDWQARTSSDQTSIAATAQFASPGARREPADFALVGVEGLKEEEVRKRGAEVGRVGAGKAAETR